MDLSLLSEHFHLLRESEDWKRFEDALKTFMASHACTEFQTAVAPATRKLETGDLLQVLAGFVREQELASADGEYSVAKLAYLNVYKYDDRPKIEIGENSEEVTIFIGDKSYAQTIQLFDYQRESMRLRFGRAKLDEITRLDELTDPTSPTVHRMVINDTNQEVPIQFFSVVSEKAKYTGETKVFADFYILPNNRPH